MSWSYSNDILQKEGFSAQAKSIYASSGGRIVLNLKLLETNLITQLMIISRRYTVVVINMIPKRVESVNTKLSKCYFTLAI